MLGHGGLRPTGLGRASRTHVRDESRIMTDDLLVDDYRVPTACTLPTADQPLRRAELDDLFAGDVLGVDQVSPLQVRLELRPKPR